jgi:hypothetical protein
MYRWARGKFGEDAVPWIFFCATTMLAVMGIAFTIGFGVSGFEAGLAISIPAIIVGGIGALVTGITLEDNGYI